MTKEKPKETQDFAKTFTGMLTMERGRRIHAAQEAFIKALEGKPMNRKQRRDYLKQQRKEGKDK